MRTTLKIVLPLIVSVASVSLLFAGYQVRNERRILRNDLARRAEILAESLRESVEHELGRGQERSLFRLVERYGQRQHLKGIAVYDTAGHLLAITTGLEPDLPLHPTAASKAMRDDKGAGEFLRPEQTSAPQTSDAVPEHVYALPLHRDDEVAGALVLVHDTSYIEIQISHTLRDALLNALVQTLLISALALLLVRWTFTGPLTRTFKWVRTLRTGQPNPLQRCCKAKSWSSCTTKSRIWPGICIRPEPPQKQKQGCEIRMLPCGRRNGCASACAIGSRTNHCLSFRIANHTCTCSMARTRRSA